MPSPRLRILDAARPEDARAWVDLWERWPRREVFAHPRYVALGLEPNTRALCAAVESEEFNVIYPFILRDLTVEPICPSELSVATDIVTPYGYGGPYYWGTVKPEQVARAFWEDFDDWASQQTVISEFVRFTLFSGDTLPYPGEVQERAPNVVRDLDLAEDAFWMDFEHKVRKNVKKALRNEVRIELDPTGERLEEFLRLYTSTMGRREASERYYFPRAYFEAIHQGLPGSFMYFHAVHKEVVVSTELVLISAENVYSFLGGTERSAFEVCPNDLLKYEVIRWAKDAGKERFVLGGGYQPEDGIYRYKLAFAPHGQIPFRTGQRIFREDLYQRLTDARCAQARLEDADWRPQPDYFPAYRAPALERQISSG